MFAFFKKIVSSVNNSLRVNGHNNHILNIVNTDKTSFSYDPQIDWNAVPQAGAGLSAQLEWRTRLTRIIGRDSEQKALLDWANETPQLSFKIIEAPGGTGKTRLAAEVAQTLSDTKDWSAGFVQLLDFEKGQRLQWQGNWLIVIDYPEHAPERLVSLFRITKAGLTQQNNDKLRVLLLCRSHDGIAAKLDAAGGLGFLSPQLDLKELPAQDNFELLTLALAKLPQENSPTVDRAAFDDWQQQSPLHQTALFVLALALHLSTPGEKQQFLPGKDLLLALVQREKKRWKKAEEGLDLHPGTLADVIAFATLFNGLPAADVNTVLRQHYGWNTEINNKVLAALAEVWYADTSNATVYPALAPDLLAAAFLWDWLSQASKRGNLNDGAVIAQLTKNRVTNSTSLLQRWHMQAYDQTFRLGLGQPRNDGSLSLLLEMIAIEDKSFAFQLSDGFNNSSSWNALHTLAAYCSKPRFIANSNNLLELATRAMQLNNHSVDLLNSGDLAGSLATAQEAVETYRRLTQDAPISFEPYLALSINNLSSRLRVTGDKAGALLAAHESLEIRQRLSQENPIAFEHDLAESMGNLALCMSETNDNTGALFNAQAALIIRRRLAHRDPTFEPDLAMSLNNLTKIFAGLNDVSGALLSAKEAVMIRRKLALTSPAIFEPDLAMSLYNLAKILNTTSDQQGALATSREAVAIYKRLTEANFAAFESKLAMSLYDLGIILGEKGDKQDALKQAKDALLLFQNSNMRHKGFFEEYINNTFQLVAHLENSSLV